MFSPFRRKWSLAFSTAVHEVSIRVSTRLMSAHGERVNRINLKTLLFKASLYVSFSETPKEFTDLRVTVING